jgi:hypothetical protein
MAKKVPFSCLVHAADDDNPGDSIRHGHQRRVQGRFHVRAEAVAQDGREHEDHGIAYEVLREGNEAHSVAGAECRAADQAGREQAPATAAVRLERRETLRKTAFLSHFYIKTIILPRQARDKHGEITPKKMPFFAPPPCRRV